MDNSFYPPALELLWKMIKGQGVNPNKIFKPHHINVKELKSTDNRIKAATIDSLWIDAEKLIGNTSFPLDMAKFWHPSYMGALGYAWLTSNTLRDGFCRIQRYVKIVSSQLGISVDDMGDKVLISLDYDCSLVRATSGLAILTHMCRINYQDELSPSKITFKDPEPSDSEKYVDYFKCPVLFGADTDSLLFPASVVDEELSGGNEQLAKLNDQVLIKYLDTLTQDDLIVKIKALIVQNLPSGTVTIDRVAEELYTSSRSLQRKIKELGTTYKKIYSECQRHLAEKYVAEGKMNLTEISFILGFSEMSSFSRSYKRWTGHSPTAHR